MMEYAAKISGASVKAGHRLILDNFSLKVKRGDFIALLGPNGAGKTTLIKTLLGFNKLSSGRIEVFDNDISRSGAQLVRVKTGYVPQSLSVDRFFPIKAGEVIRLGAGREEALKTAKELNITGLLNRPFGLLSGGEKQKILLAMALARKPELLLLDEPNLNLDPLAYRDFLKFTDKIHVKHGLTVIFITHLINQLPESCKRVVVMKNGKVSFETSAKKLLKCRKAPELIYG